MSRPAFLRSRAARAASPAPASPRPDAPPTSRRRPGVWLRSPAPAPAPARARGAAGLGVGLVAAALLLAGGGPAAAHNVLISMDPADGSTVPSAPDAITLTFNEPAVALGTQIQVTGPDGSELAVGEPQLVDNSVVQPLAEERPAGAYQVVWRVTSADGHPIEGELAFEATDAVGAAEAPATPPADEPTSEAPDDAASSGDEATQEPAAPSDEAEAEAGAADDAPTDDGAESGEQFDDASLPGWVIPVGVLLLAVVVGLVVRARRNT